MPLGLLYIISSKSMVLKVLLLLDFGYLFVLSPILKNLEMNFLQTQCFIPTKISTDNEIVTLPRIGLSIMLKNERGFTVTTWVKILT